MTCPKCKDDHCFIIEESESYQKGFGFFKGCCGFLIVGPIGWLCGLCGMGKGHSTRRAYWVCPHCGQKFKA
jgi:hypothetical protein